MWARVLVRVCSQRSNGVSEGKAVLVLVRQHLSPSHSERWLRFQSSAVHRRAHHTKRTRLHEDAMEVITTASSLSMTPRRSCAPHVTPPAPRGGVSSKTTRGRRGFVRPRARLRGGDDAEACRGTGLQHVGVSG